MSEALKSSCGTIVVISADARWRRVKKNAFHKTTCCHFSYLNESAFLLLYISALKKLIWTIFFSTMGQTIGITLSSLNSSKSFFSWISLENKLVERFVWPSFNRDRCFSVFLYRSPYSLSHNLFTRL